MDHIANIHKFKNDLFPECQHGDIGIRTWLKAGDKNNDDAYLIYFINCISPTCQEILWFSHRSAAAAADNLCPDLCRTEFLRFRFEILQLNRYMINDTQYRFLEKSEKHDGHQRAFFGRKKFVKLFLSKSILTHFGQKKLKFPKKNFRHKKT